MMCNKKTFFTIFVFFCVIISTIIIQNCTNSEPVPEDTSSYVLSIQEWHGNRIESLKKNVLSVVGLFWLKDGENSFGSDPTNDIVFQKEESPEFIGTFTVRNGKVRIKINPGIEVLCEGETVSEMELQNDFDGKATILSLEPLSWYVIRRNEDFGIRLRDIENPLISQFKSIVAFTIDPEWRLEARFEPHEKTKTIGMTTASGAVRELPSPGSLTFNISNKPFKLDVMTLVNANSYFIIFADETNGYETYGGGRFLFVEKAGADGTTIIDFNKSINPPCALTDFYACPLPPPQNRLPIKVTGGEKKYESTL
ncbi:DUF1684 domain-containing protein [Candidatus Latescibacterota bacterium]